MELKKWLVLDDEEVMWSFDTEKAAREKARAYLGEASGQVRVAMLCYRYSLGINEHPV